MGPSLVCNMTENQCDHIYLDVCVRVCVCVGACFISSLCFFSASENNEYNNQKYNDQCSYC